MSIYNKPYLTFEQQLDLLKSRGLEIPSDSYALKYLSRLGYYRLSGYWYPFRKLSSTLLTLSERREDEFVVGAQFCDAVELYVFDKKLRLIILDAIERIEVAIRVDIAYVLGKKDPFAHINPALLHGSFTKVVDPKTGVTRFHDWLIKQEYLLYRSKEDFVQHYQKKYGLPLPIWVVIELWDFGMLSVFYQGMTIKDKKIIADKYKIPNWQIMQSWLRCLNYVRNTAAHHSRLWNRKLVIRPKLDKLGEMPGFDHLVGNVDMITRVYAALCVLIHFMDNVYLNSSWKKRLKNLIDQFPQKTTVNIHNMGFPKNWYHQKLWSI
ncbi:MAG TPA: Abi family protein [Gammaproteobacteria bacterium]|nr:Abi family protein [Gammaproteobacteria bacterium]